MERTLKITPPEGYEIDKEKSTLDNIVFKKIDDIIIKWNSTLMGVEIKDEDEHFFLNASCPSLYCSWHDATRYYNGFLRRLPTKKQIKIIAKHIKKINTIIEEEQGYKIEGYLWSRESKDDEHAYVVKASEDIYYPMRKCLSNHVRYVIDL